MNEIIQRRLAALKHTAMQAFNAYGEVYSQVRAAAGVGREIDTPAAREKYAPAEIDRQKAEARGKAKEVARAALAAYTATAGTLAEFRDLHDPAARLAANSRLTPEPAVVSTEMVLGSDKAMLAAIQEGTRVNAALLELQTRDRARRDLASLKPDALVQRARQSAEAGDLPGCSVALEELGGRDIDPDKLKADHAHVLAGLRAEGLQEAGAIHRAVEKMDQEVALLAAELDRGEFSSIRGGMLEHLGATLNAALDLPSHQAAMKSDNLTEKAQAFKAMKAAGVTRAAA